MVHLDDISVEKAREYLVCRGLTDDSVINATIDMTGRRIIIMDDVVRVLTIDPGRNPVEGTRTAASFVSGAVLGHFPNHLHAFARLCADVRRKNRMIVVSTLLMLGISTSPGISRSARGTGLWNASAVILEHGFISSSDFEELLDPSTGDYTKVISSDIFLQRDDVRRIYFYSKPVEDYMRAEFNEHYQRIGGTTVRASRPHF